MWSGTEAAAGDRRLAVLDRVASGDLVAEGWRRAERMRAPAAASPRQGPRRAPNFRRKC